MTRYAVVFDGSAFVFKAWGGAKAVREARSIIRNSGPPGPDTRVPFSVYGMPAGTHTGHTDRSEVLKYGEHISDGNVRMPGTDSREVDG